MTTQTETDVERTTAMVLAPTSHVAPPTVSLQDWAHRITRAAGQAVEAIVMTGRLLTEAKEALPHGSFETIFKGHHATVAHPVPFSISTARMYMAIAQHPVLSNRYHGNDLPVSWRTLYELAHLPAPRVEKWLKDQTITPELTRDHAVLLRENACRSTPALIKHVQAGRARRRYYDAPNSLAEAEKRVCDYYVEVAEEVQSGVVWIPPFTDLEHRPTPPRPKPRHRW